MRNILPHFSLVLSCFNYIAKTVPIQVSLFLYTYLVENQRPNFPGSACAKFYAARYFRLFPVYSFS